MRCVVLPHGKLIANRSRKRPMRSPFPQSPCRRRRSEGAIPFGSANSRRSAAAGGSPRLPARSRSCCWQRSAGGGWHEGRAGGDNVNQPEIATQPAPQPTTPEINDSAPQVDRAFATLIQSSDTAWDTPPAGGDRLSAGVLRLVQGSAELHFDKGTVVFLTGPAALELRGPDEVSLQRGSLNARVPKPAVGFTVVTPLSRVVDLGTEFDVVVQESGAVATLVHEGRVSLQPQRGQEQRAKPIELAVGALDHATTSVPDIAAPVLPVMTVAGGDEGRYLGMVSLDGKTAEFHSPQAFDAFQARVLQQMRKAPRQFRRQWPVMVEKSTVGAAASGKTSPDRQEPPAVKDPGRHAGPDVSGGSNGSAAPAAPGTRVVDVDENGKKISISDSKDSGITVTITETVNGKKKTTQVHAATAAELAGKNPYAHRLYRQYHHPRPKTGKTKKE